jgi:hypothetical protein
MVGGRRNKMKMMVAVAVIATLMLLAMVGVASANWWWIEYVQPPEVVDRGGEFNYSVKLDAFEGVKLDDFDFDVELYIYLGGVLAGDPEQYPIKYKCEPEDKRCNIGPVKLEKAGKYEFKVSFSWRYTVDSKTGEGPTIYSVPPKIKDFKCPSELYHARNLECEAYIEDEIGGYGNCRAFLTVCDRVKLSPPDEKNLLGNVSEYIWVITLEEHHFSEKDVNKTCGVYVDYFNDFWNITSRPVNLTIRPYYPIISDGPYLDGNHLSKDNAIDDIRWKDLDEGNFSFNVIIEDEIEKGNAILQVCRIDNNDSSCPENYSLKSDEKEGDPCKYNYYNDSVRFNRNDAYKNFSLRLYYDRSELPSMWHHPWEKYNITIIPFEVEFENATVYRPKGNWSDEFKYSVWVNASKNLTIALYVFDPCLESWPWIHVANKKYNKYGGKTLNWTIGGDTIFSENCSGKSKFYFEYESKETEVYPGPNLGLNEYVDHNGPSPKEPPEFNNSTTNPKVTIYRNWSQSSTPCNYSVNVTTKDEYKVRLFVKDPTGEWIRKRDNEISSTTKNITWSDIKPFESLNIDNISQYIDNGTRANFTFEYNGHKANKNFSGPLLVGAFKEPRIELRTGDEEINYNDPFNYSINVYGSKRLNITLMYRENPNGEWITDGIEVPTRQYNNTFNWTSPPLKWGCRAIKSWAEVKMEVEIEGEQKHIKVD